MRRWAFNIAAAVSLLLFVATVVMCGRSYAFADVWIHQTAAGLRDNITSSHGSISLTHSMFPPDAFGPFTFTRHQAVPPHSMSASFRFGGFGWDRHADSMLTFWYIVVPYWAILAATAPLPVFRWRTWSAERFGAGRCPACGYNLTGNTSGVCPECGTPMPAEAKP